jgi:hypothetical protein
MREDTLATVVGGRRYRISYFLISYFRPHIETSSPQEEERCRTDILRLKRLYVTYKVTY